MSTVSRGLLSASLTVVVVVSSFAAERAESIRFKKTHLDAKFRSEGVAAADFNHDGQIDVAAGSVYFAAPDWDDAHHQGRGRGVQSQKLQ